MSSKQRLIDASTRHQIFLQRHAGGLFRQMIPFIDEAIDETVTLLANANTALSKERYKNLLQNLRIINNNIYKKMNVNIKQQIKLLAKYEAEFNKKILIDATKLNGDALLVPSVKQLESAAFTSIMDSKFGYTGTMSVSKALEKFGHKKTGDIIRKVRLGIALGKTNKSIADDVQTVVASIKNQAYTLTRTITNHVAAVTRKEFYQENQEVITGYQIIATLDDRTTLTCGALDGKVFSLDEFEEPPYHWGCRTTFIAVVDPKYDAGSAVGGVRPSKGSSGPKEVSSKTTYNSWLKDQSKEFQNEVLGPTRADMFRSGTNVDKFVDSNYTPINVTKLKKLDDKYN